MKSNQETNKFTMKRNKILVLLLVLCLFTVSSYAQNNAVNISAIQSLFGDAKFKIDTSAVPEDRLTEKIRILRAERGPINMDNVIKYTIQSQQANDKVRPKEYYDRFLEQCQQGEAHRMIENILINLYRQCFTEEEADQLIEFFKSSAGKKMRTDFLLLSATGATAVQKIVKTTADKLELEMKSEGKIK